MFLRSLLNVLWTGLFSKHPHIHLPQFTLSGVVSEKIQGFFNLLFEVLVHRSPEHRRCSVWGTTGPAGTSSICGFSTWNRSQNKAPYIRVNCEEDSIFQMNLYVVIILQRMKYRYSDKHYDIIKRWCWCLLCRTRQKGIIWLMSSHVSCLPTSLSLNFSTEPLDFLSLQSSTLTQRCLSGEFWKILCMLFTIIRISSRQTDLTGWRLTKLTSLLYLADGRC